MVLNYLLAFFISLITGLILTPIFAKIMLKFGIVSKPITLRKDARGLPLGGISIYLSFIIAVLLTLFYTSGITLELKGILIGGSLVMLLGLYDDAKELSVGLKFLGELIAVLILIIFGVKTQIILISPNLNLLVTAIWILGIINAFNLLDILDGLSCGLGTIASLTFLIVAILTHHLSAAIIAGALAGSSLAFLKYNFPEAKVFMGDTGSLFIGFVLAAVAIDISYAPLGREIALLTPILILGLPIYDTLFLMLMRVLEGKSIFRKSNDHLALRLVAMGFGQKKTVLIMYSLGILFSISALTLRRVGNKWGIIVILVVVIFSIVGRRMSRIKVDR